MGRIGIREDAELEKCLDRCANSENVLLEGLYTHFATADEADKTYAYEQLSRFLAIKEKIEKSGFSPIVHAANSAAAVELPEAQFDMVSQGITLYGGYPSEAVDKRKMDLRQAMSCLLYTSRCV